jgi:NTP pyrophosphatase (non-canonical NTP hydrolase)
MTDNAKELLALAELRTANETRQREWDTLGQLTLAYRGNELAGEVGEACNVIKKLERERLGIAGSRDSTAHLAEELADVIICTDLIAMQAGIDLDAAVVAKFNASSEKVGLRTRLSAPPSEAERQPLYTTPQPAAGRNEVIEVCIRELEYCRDHGHEPDITTIKKLKALRREAPAPAEGKPQDTQFAQAWVLNEVLCEIIENGVTESREIATRVVCHPRIKFARPDTAEAPSPPADRRERVKELEAGPPLLDARSITELDELVRSLEARALRAEQQRDEAYERAAALEQRLADQRVISNYSREQAIAAESRVKALLAESEAKS